MMGCCLVMSRGWDFLNLDMFSQRLNYSVLLREKRGMEVDCTTSCSLRQDSHTFRGNRGPKYTRIYPLLQPMTRLWRLFLSSLSDRYARRIRRESYEKSVDDGSCFEKLTLVTILLKAHDYERKDPRAARTFPMLFKRQDLLHSPEMC